MCLKIQYDEKLNKARCKSAAICFLVAGDIRAIFAAAALYTVNVQAIKHHHGG